MLYGLSYNWTKFVHAFYKKCIEKWMTDIKSFVMLNTEEGVTLALYINESHMPEIIATRTRFSL